MASRETYTFALIKALYDDRQDLLTTLRPFLLGVLKTDVSISATETQAALATEQAMRIPLHVIQKCAETAEKAELISIGHSSVGNLQYTLTIRGQDEALDAASLANVQRRVKHATNFLALCMKERGMVLEVAEVDATLRRLIARNLETVVGFVAQGGIDDPFDVKTESAIEESLAECVTFASQTQPDVYETLRDLVYGSVVLATLSQGDSQLIETAKSPFHELVAYVDTNWVMGVLELDTPARNLAAAELTRLARQSGIELRMLDFVVNETRTLLKFYEDEYDSGRLPTDPSRVFMQMKMRGLKPSDVLLLRSRLKETLDFHGIAIEHTGVEPVRHQPEDPIWIDQLTLQKRSESTRAALTDLAAIAYVREQRAGSVADLETSKFILLSCDVTLARFNTGRMGHAAAGTFPEVVLDKMLTTVLWLKNPGLEVPLDAVVAAHSRGLLHRQAVWFQVVAELTKVANDGRASRQDISVFLASEGPELIAEEVDSVAQVTPEVIQAMVLQAKLDHVDELETVRNALKQEGDQAVAAVQNAATQTLGALKREAAESAQSASGQVDGLQKRVDDLEQRQIHAREELVEGAKTRARVWAFVVPVVFTLVVAVAVLSFRTGLEGWLGAKDFQSVFVPLVVVVVAVMAAGLAKLTYQVMLSRGERRARTLL